MSGAVRTSWDGAAYASLEGRHGAGGGNALRAAVLGANDGLVSNLSLVMGVAGADFSQHTVLLTGLAGLIAGACSMAMGEWLSVQSSRELYQKQIATEADELAQVPDEEKEELVLIYQSKGMDRATAEQTAEREMANKDAALDTLVREEIGVNPKDLGDRRGPPPCPRFPSSPSARSFPSRRSFSSAATRRWRRASPSAPPRSSRSAP